MWSVSWLYVLEAVVIVTVNIITIVIFTTTPRLHRRQYALIVNLAVADLLLGLFSVPMHIATEETTSFFNSRFAIPLVYYFMQDMFFGTASLFGLSALAIERAHATYFPFKHNTLSNVPYIVGIAVMWALSLLTCIASYTYTTDKTIFIAVKGLQIAMTLAIITSGYFLIFINARCMATSNNQAIQHSNRKLNVTLAIVTIISLVTWSPYMILVFVSANDSTLRKLQVFQKLRRATKVLQFSNSFANFFVYSFRMRDFKREILRRCRCCASNQVSASNSVPLGSSVRIDGSRKSHTIALDAPAT